VLIGSFQRHAVYKIAVGASAVLNVPAMASFVWSFYVFRVAVYKIAEGALYASEYHNLPDRVIYLWSFDVTF
jgi:hypothetical protein